MQEQNRLNWVRSDEDTRLTTKRKCELLEVSRSGAYYKPHEKTRRLRRLSDKDIEDRMAKIDHIHTRLSATGARKMAKALTDEGMPTKRYEAAELMDQMNIKAIYPRPNTSKPAKEHPKFPYLLRGKKIFLPNQAWAIDITYIPFKGGHMYLTAIIDLFSRMIVGWELADSLEVAPVIACTKSAFERYGIPAILNSDQGSHFTSNAYIALLADFQVAQSMDGKARWVDNVFIERWFRTLKSEYVHINVFDTPRQLRLGISQFIDDYNNLRLHESLDYITPATAWGAAFKMAA